MECVTSAPIAEMRLYSQIGERLYINEDERTRFVDCAYASAPVLCTFYLTLAFTGCRLSEALSLSRPSFQLTRSTVTVRSLKKRGRNVFREIPIPPELCALIDETHRGGCSLPLWRMSRETAWRKVKGVMAEAGITGKQATPKGLRHGFGVHGCLKGVQLNMLQKWMGHANIATTAIYANAIGPEEYAIASRMWR